MTELQEKTLELVKEFDEICQANNIEYYLIGGSLIGAVRHHGFIPWDDDADVIMTRENWKKFHECFIKKNIHNRVINSIDDNPDHALPVAQYSDCGSTNIYRFHILHPEVSGILFDILIMDPLPDDENIKQEYIRTVSTQCEVANLYYPYNYRNNVDTNFKTLNKRIKKYGKQNVIRSLDWNYEVEKSNIAFYAQFFGGAIHFWPSRAFGKPKYVEF